MNINKLPRQHLRTTARNISVFATYIYIDIVSFLNK